jgi:phospho-N-acetylmuramoyl-pentapeptide-transferase
MSNSFATSFWIAFAVSAVLAWPTLLLLRRLRAESIISQYAPDGHRVKAGTPTMGGTFVVVGLLAGTIASGRTEVLLIVLGFALIGFVDDYVVPMTTSHRGLGWAPKLVLQFLFALVWPLFMGWTVQSLQTAFFIVAFANAANFADGLDALAGSLLVFALCAFIPFFVITGNWAAGLASAAVGALLPFLVLNAPPAKVFMGDVGSLPLGAAYGICFAEAPFLSAAWPWLVSLILLAELLLVPLQLAAVKLLRRRIFPATPIHHAFEIKGWPETRVVWTFAVCQMALTAAALTEVFA